MEKELIRHFIKEYKQKQEWTKRWYDNHMEMDSWFKYSGKIEESKSMNQWLTLQQERTPIDNPMIEFYFENPDYNIAEIAKVFEVSESTIRCILNYHFKKRRENVVKKDLKVETPKNNFIDSKNKSNRIYNDMSKYKLIKYK